MFDAGMGPSSSDMMCIYSQLKRYTHLCAFMYVRVYICKRLLTHVSTHPFIPLLRPVLLLQRLYANLFSTNMYVYTQVTHIYTHVCVYMLHAHMYISVHVDGRRGLPTCEARRGTEALEILEGTYRTLVKGPLGCIGSFDLWLTWRSISG